MKDYLLTKRMLEFKKTVIKWQNLPKVWKAKFEDKQDMRIWFNHIINQNTHKEFVGDIKEVLKGYNVKILTDEEKEKEFLKIVKKCKMIPEYGSYSFSDNNDMYIWYINYKTKHYEYAKKIYNIIKDYDGFDLDIIWEDIKQEFLILIKRLKRIPEYGESFTTKYNLDIRIIYEKLMSSNDPKYDQTLIHIETYRDKTLKMDIRIKELQEKIEELGYLPELKEYQFSDGVDMFTWYTKYQHNIPVIKEHIEPYIKKEHPNKNQKLNIYFIPQFTVKTNPAYNIKNNFQERLDLSYIISYEQQILALNNKYKKISFTDIKKGISKDENNSTK